MKHSALIFWIGLALVGSAAYGSWVAWRNLHVEEPHSSGPATQTVHHAPAGPPIKDFQLVERSGRKFDSKELKGHVWIGSFFFTACPGPCWQMNQALKGVHDEFKDTDLRWSALPAIRRTTIQKRCATMPTGSRPIRIAGCS